MSDTEANKALVRRFFEEVMNEGNVDLVDEIFAPGYVNRHAHPRPDAGTERRAPARDERAPRLPRPRRGAR